MHYLSSGYWWLAFYPGMSLLIVVLLFDLIGENVEKCSILKLLRNKGNSFALIIFLIFIVILWNMLLLVNLSMSWRNLQEKWVTAKYISILTDILMRRYHFGNQWVIETTHKIKEIT